MNLKRTLTHFLASPFNEYEILCSVNTDNPYTSAGLVGKV